MNDRNGHIPDRDDAKRAVRLIAKIVEGGQYYLSMYHGLAAEALRTWPADECWLPGAMDAPTIARLIGGDFGSGDALAELARETLCGSRRAVKIDAMERTVVMIEADRAAGSDHRPQHPVASPSAGPIRITAPADVPASVRLAQARRAAR